MSQEYVALDLVTFRPIEHPANAAHFFRVLESRGGVFVPQFIELRRNRRTHRLPYQKGNSETWSRCWAVGGFTLRREAPTDVLASLAIWPDRAKNPAANSFVMYLPVEHFSTSRVLSELVELGNDLCEVLSPCYGSITLPSLPKLRVVRDPDRGLPGLGWATWLGPEYEEIVNLQPTNGIEVKRLSGGERLILCAWPQEVVDPGERVRKVLESAERQLPDGILQPEKGRAKLVPTFRFREERRANPSEGGQDSNTQPSEQLTFGPDVKTILAKYEPDLIDRGVPNGIGGAVFFTGLTPSDAKQLLDLLPKSQEDVSTESSPTFREMIELAARFPKIQYYGYRLLPELGKEQIVLSGFFLPKEDVTTSQMDEIKSLQPDEVEWEEFEGRSVVRVGWE
jgi:hypothetical protein